MYTVYIIYSKSLDRFYVGFTGDSIENRIRKHLANHKGFTNKSSDWQLVYAEEYSLKKEAISREREIKKWKSRAMIEKLLRNPD